MGQNQNKYHQLRKRFPFLVFERYQIECDHHAIRVRFIFNLSGIITFEPEFSISLKPLVYQLPNDSFLHNLVFHIGMAEMISYWKTSCPPRIIVKPFSLQPEALEWWKNLYYHGLGEFFHTNGIVPDYHDFLTFECESGHDPERHNLELNELNLVPVGGGKDSVVTLEILTQSNYRVIPFFLNPTKAALDVVNAAGFKTDQAVIINRTLDPQLLRMNEEGFLNGHTPFSALLAFYSLIPAVLSGSKNIVLSNESSANEPSIPGTMINHQYSKSYAFEKDFREYCSHYISPAFKYFSFLRPLNELQIASLFSGFEKYHDFFRSCNVGSKAGIWCGKCPKCLFTFIILSPFLAPAELLKIFGHNLLDDPHLQLYFDQLCGLESEKPFDCIGTVDEVNAALHAAMMRYDAGHLPVLLAGYKNYGSCKPGDCNFESILSQFNTLHAVPENLLQLLKSKMDERIS